MIRFSIAEAGSSADMLIIPVFEDKSFDTITKELDELHGGAFSARMKLKDFEGKKKQTTLVYTEDADVPRILLIGLGKHKELTIRRWKQTVGAATKAAQGKKCETIGFLLPTTLLSLFDAKTLGKETVIAMETANYIYDEYKAKDGRTTRIETVWLTGLTEKKDIAQVKKGIDVGQTIADAVNFARRLGNTPPTIMTPSLIAKEAKKLASKENNLTVKVLSRPEMKTLGMGCLLGVSRGSEEEPKFVILEYGGGKAKDKPTVLVGKGITFDSGGLSLKPGQYMNDMKFDMLGAATVLGTIKAAAALGIKKNIVGLVPSCENMPSGTAYRPDDILVAMNGKSVLVKNTDAEGRLILADGLSYAAKYKPKEVIDFATLTGACMVALGNERSGLFSEENKIVEKLLGASDSVGEQLWRLPIGEEYREAMKCDIADIHNIGGVGNPRYGGASTAAAFLEFFTDYPWAHIDLSCSHYGDKGNAYLHGGANGFGVQTMVAYLSK